MKGIKNLRLAAKLTQHQLGAAVGVSQVAVSAWESGAAYPSAALLPRLAETLGCSIDALYGLQPA